MPSENTYYNYGRSLGEIIVKRDLIVILLCIFIRELHNDLIKSKNERGLSKVWKDNKLLINNTGLRYIIPRNVFQNTSICVDVKSVSKRNNYNVLQMYGETNIQKKILVKK